MQTCRYFPDGLCFPFQELEDAAMKVLEEQQRVKVLLEEKTAELAVIQAEYETKKKEVCSHLQTIALPHMNCAIQLTNFGIEIAIEHDARTQQWQLQSKWQASVPAFVIRILHLLIYTTRLKPKSCAELAPLAIFM